MTRGARAWLASFIVAAGVGGAGWLGAGLAGSEASRGLARVGVGLAVASGFLALGLKGWAVRRSLRAALLTVVVMFQIRAVAVLGGLMLVLRRGGNAAGYLAGFFAAYFLLQWLEIAFVMTESRRLGEGVR